MFNDENRIATVRGETLEIFRNWESSIITIGTMETIGLETFDDVVTIHHANDENLIERRFVEEKYARTVGLVEKKVMIYGVAIALIMALGCDYLFTEVFDVDLPSGGQ